PNGTPAGGALVGGALPAHALPAHALPAHEPASQPPKPKVAAETQKMTPVGKTQVDWQNTPPPVRGSKDSVASPPGPAPAPATVPGTPTTTPATDATAALAVHDKPTLAHPPGTTVPVAAPAVALVAAPVAPPPVDPILELARDSTEARRGLGTLPLLIERINL